MANRRAQIRFLALVGASWLAMLVISLRFERPEYRAWELAAEANKRGFAPNRALRMAELGDLEALSWVRSLQTPEPVAFSTDRWGFRNPDGITAPRIVVVGDSYVGGCGLSDDQTLTRRMSVTLGEPVYNFAFSYSRMPALFLDDRRFAEHPPVMVVFAPNQRSLVPQLLSPRAADAAGSMPTLESLGEWLAEAAMRSEVSNGLTRSARYAYNGVLHALPGTENLVRLPDGSRALVLSLTPQALLVPASLRQPGPVANAIVAFSRLLARRGTRLVFAPIPDTGNVYPELYPRQRSGIADPSLLDVVLARVRAAGVDVVDLPRLFRANKWPYLYQRDDSHWNERAVELSALAVSYAVRSRVARSGAAAMPPEVPAR